MYKQHHNHHMENLIKTMIKAHIDSNEIFQKDASLPLIIFYLLPIDKDELLLLRQRKNEQFEETNISSQIDTFF